MAHERWSVYQRVQRWSESALVTPSLPTPPAALPPQPPRLCVRGDGGLQGGARGRAAGEGRHRGLAGAGDGDAQGACVRAETACVCARGDGACVCAGAVVSAITLTRALALLTTLASSTRTLPPHPRIRTHAPPHPQVAAKHRATKFMRIISDSCIEGYPDANVPTIFVYEGGVVKTSIVGLATLGGHRVSADSECVWRVARWVCGGSCCALLQMRRLIRTLLSPRGASPSHPLLPSPHLQRWSGCSQNMASSRQSWKRTRARRSAAVVAACVGGDMCRAGGLRRRRRTTTCEPALSPRAPCAPAYAACA